jgi:hypothetical protein
MGTKKIFELMKNKKIENVVYTGKLDVNLIKELENKCKNILFFSNLKIDTFRDSDVVKTYNVNETIEIISNWPKSNKMVDMNIFASAENPFDVRIHMSLWMPLLRKNGLFVIMNASEELKQGVDDYVRIIGEEFFDVSLDLENQLLVIEHK